ncbi:MAG: sulfatase [Candidatus Brocadiaceae bacterium]|jgi:hypothetical protein
MPPTNLILISFDTLRFDALSAAPDRRLLGEDAGLARTPVLDEIAAEGTFFARGVTTCPYTSTSHASIFTGTYWPKHGVLDLFGYPMRGEAEPLAEALRERGYRTAQNAGRGWFDGDMFDLDRVGLNRGYEFEAFGGWWRRKSWRWLRKVVSEGRWYVFFHHMRVHRPYGKSHRKFRALVRRDLKDDTPFRRLRELYLRNVTSVDKKFGRVWERLRKEGALDDTLVVILSDHGEGLSVHSTIHCNPGGWQEGVCRVPVIFWAPGCVQPGQVIEEPISTVDVAPTIVDLLGLDWRPRLGFDGRSLAEVVRGGAPVDGVPQRDCFLFASMSDGPDTPPLMHGMVRDVRKYVSFGQVRPEQWEELERKWRESADHRKKQSRHYNMSRLLERFRRGELELLFDVEQDPHELHNLAEQRPEEAETFRDAMERWYAENQPGVDITRAELDEEEEKDIQRRLSQLGYLE